MLKEEKTVFARKLEHAPSENQPGSPFYTETTATPPPSPAVTEEVKKLDELVTKSHRILFRCKTVFPFDLFPDELIIDENKIDIIHKTFFYTEAIYSVVMKNVHGATVQTGILFSSLDIEVIGFENDPPPLKFLWAADATKARRIITGLTTAIKEGIDLSKIPAEDLTKKVEEIGIARNG
jgi:hypothetical protein